ncbi:MAG: P1 family peptidase, partial [Caulobacterales bacterium]
LEPHNLVQTVDAIVLSGGSVYGLAAADGVAAIMGAAGKGFKLAARPDVPPSPIVPAAILYDLANGGNKAWGEAPPYAKLGALAYRNASQDVPLGNAGAGYGAFAGGFKGGQGAASYVSADGVTVGALACVNAFGSVVMPGSKTFWSWPFEQNGEFGGLRPDPAAQPFSPEDWGYSKADALPRTNTTISCIATDAALTRVEAQRVAQMASAGLARAIRPIFAPSDGDVVFVLAAGGKQLAEPRSFAIAKIGNLAADCLARAVARGVYEAAPLAGRPAWRDLP